MQRERYSDSIRPRICSVRTKSGLLPWHLAAGLCGGAGEPGVDGERAGTIGLELPDLRAQATEM